MNELVKGIQNMSEPQNEEPVYVVNKQRRESEAVVHMPDCEKIRHQVEQDARPEGLSTRLQEIGRDAEGNLIYREMRVPAASHYTANYMTLMELKNSGFRYHPCGYCQPPVPTVDGPIPISVKARNLNTKHLGKESIGWGVLERFTITGLLNADGSKNIMVDAEFTDGIHHRFNPETRLEYPRPNQKRQS